MKDMHRLNFGKYDGAQATRPLRDTRSRWRNHNSRVRSPFSKMVDS